MFFDTPAHLTHDHTAQSVLQIQLLGPPAVSWAGQPVALARRQSRAILYRIASSLQPVSREQLCFLFWPDTCEAVARRNLTVLLNHLRRELPLPNLITTVDDTLALARQEVWIDTLALARVTGSSLQEQTVAEIQEAVDCYRGPFLHGFTLPANAEFEAWMLQERQNWERRYLAALAVLIERQIALRDYRGAIEAARRYLATDELAEEVHRRLIWLYAATGDRAAALRQFDQCEALLERELDVSPLPETWALYEALRDGTFQIEAAEPQPGRPSIQVASSAVSHTLLPTPQNPLLGRDHEVTAACAMLQEPAVRLLTLTGPGGSGKTRLALQIAAELRSVFTNGVVFVALAPLRDPALVLDAIARACGVQQMSAPREHLPLIDRLRDYLRDKHLLLLLDNCEHLLPAAADVADLLTFAPQLHILVTSRAALHLSGEHVFPVPPLPLPDLTQLPAVEHLADQPAVALLLARAQAHHPAFQLTPENAADLAAICVRLDGLPLAIELAAARLKLLSPHALLQRLDHRLALLTNGARDLPIRQQTLRATIDWSYELLEPAEQLLFKRLAVFAGGCTLEAVEALADGGWRMADGAYDIPTTKIQNPKSEIQNIFDGLTSLVDKSLLCQEVRADEPRFTMLETIREYASQWLEESGEADAIQRQHALYYLALAEKANLQQQFGKETWLARLELEHDNLRAALAWSLEVTILDFRLPILDCEQHCSTTEIRNLKSKICNRPLPLATLGLRLAAALWPLWYVHGHLREGREWLAQALAAADNTEVEACLRVQALNGASRLAWAQGDYEAARALAEASLALSQELGDERGKADALSILGGSANEQGDYALASSLDAQSLAIRQTLGDQQGIALSLHNLGGVAISRSEYEQAATLFEESLVLFRKLEDKWGIAQALYCLGDTAHHRGDYQLATTLFTESLGLYQEIGNRWRTAWLLNKLGEVAQYQGAYQRARSLYEESLLLFRELGQRKGIALVLHNLGYETLQQGDYERAKALHQESLALFQAIGVKWGIGLALGLLGVVATEQGDYAWANRLQEQSLAIWREIGSKRGIARTLNRLGEVAHYQGDDERALALQRESLALAWEVDDRLGIATGLEGVAAALNDQQQPELAAQLLGAAEGLREAMGAPLRRVEQGHVEQTVAAVRSQLDASLLRAAWAEGRATPLAQNIAEALTPDQPITIVHDQNFALAHFMPGEQSWRAQPSSRFTVPPGLRDSHLVTINSMTKAPVLVHASLRRRSTIWPWRNYLRKIVS